MQYEKKLMGWGNLVIKCRLGPAFVGVAFDFACWMVCVQVSQRICVVCNLSNFFKSLFMLLASGGTVNLVFSLFLVVGCVRTQSCMLVYAHSLSRSSTIEFLLSSSYFFLDFA